MRIASIARYPFKSMAGEALPAAEVGFNGLAGDRLHAFVQEGLHTTFPWFTGREWPELVRWRPAWSGAGKPPRQALTITAPGGEQFAATDAALRESIERASGARIRLQSNGRGNCDAAHASFILASTVRALCEAAGVRPDARRFRMNFVIDADLPPFAEAQWLGRTLAAGSARFALTQPDGRCKMITLDPDTAAQDLSVLRACARLNGGEAGVYGSVVAEGVVEVGAAVAIE